LDKIWLISPELRILSEISKAMGLELIPDKVVEHARAIKGPDLGETADRTMANKEVRHRLPVCAPRKVLEYAHQPVVGHLDDLKMVALRARRRLARQQRREWLRV
jgi:hypothetical protein